MDWQLIAFVVMTLVAGFAGGFLMKFKKVVKELHELLGVIHLALEDDQLTKEEIAEIMQEGSDVIMLFAKKVNP